MLQCMGSQRVGHNWVTELKPKEIRDSIIVLRWLVRYCTIFPEKATAPHSSTPAWKIPWTEEPGRLQSLGLLRVGGDWATSLSLSCIGEGNGNPLQCSCLENPRDGGAWWADVYRVTQSRTRLKWLSSSNSSMTKTDAAMEYFLSRKEIFQLLSISTQVLPPWFNYHDSTIMLSGFSILVFQT